MDSYNIFVGHGDEAKLKILVATLGKIGHRIAGTASSRNDLVDSVIADPPDLILSSAEYPDGDGIEGLIDIATSRRVKLGQEADITMEAEQDKNA